MYARQTLQGVRAARPCLRLFVRHCRRQRPVRFYSESGSDGKSAAAAAAGWAQPEKEQAEALARQIQELERKKSSREAASVSKGGNGIGISPPSSSPGAARDSAAAVKEDPDQPASSLDATLLSSYRIVRKAEDTWDISRLKDEERDRTDTFVYATLEDGVLHEQHKSQLEQYGLGPEDTELLRVSGRHILLEKEDGTWEVARVLGMSDSEDFFIRKDENGEVTREPIASLDQYNLDAEHVDLISSSPSSYAVVADGQGGWGLGAIVGAEDGPTTSEEADRLPTREQMESSLSESDLKNFSENPEAYVLVVGLEGQEVTIKDRSDLDGLNLAPEDQEMLRLDPGNHFIYMNEEGAGSVLSFADSTSSYGTTAQELASSCLEKSDLAKYEQNPDAYIITVRSLADGGLDVSLEQRSNVASLGLSDEQQERLLSDPSAYYLVQSEDGGSALVSFADGIILDEEEGDSEASEASDIQVDDQEALETRARLAEKSNEADTTSEEVDGGDDAKMTDKEIQSVGEPLDFMNLDEVDADPSSQREDEGPSLQQNLHELEMYDKSDVTAVGFQPHAVTKEHYLRHGRGNATIAGGNLEGVVQDRVKALTDRSQTDVRWAPDLAKRMMRGGLMSFNSAEERDAVVDAAADYAHKLGKSASKARQGKGEGEGEDGVSEHDFAPVSATTQNEIMARYMRGKYPDPSKRRFDSDVLNQVSAAMLRNGTYLGRDSSVFLSKVQNMVNQKAPQPVKKAAPPTPPTPTPSSKSGKNKKR